MTKEMERLKEIEAEKEKLRAKIDTVETPEGIEEITEQARKLSNEEKEIRKKMDLRDQLKPKTISEEVQEVSEAEKRAKDFQATGKTEFRAMLSTGKIAQPTKVAGVNGLPEEVGSIVDDVKAVALTGNGAYTVAYKKTEAVAADVTDGSNIGGTGATFDYVIINPKEWGIHDEISNQVAKMTPLDYLAEIEKSAVIALRTEAEKKVYAAVLASDLLGTATEAFGPDYLRDIVLQHKTIAGKGGVKLYLNRADLVALGKIRGTSEKKPLYSITFDAGSYMSGTISEGGLAVPFSITEQLAAGTQLFGQPQTVEMPMWDNYRIETNEGGEYFRKNMIGIRGIQTANADLCAFHGLTKITQA